MLEPEVPRAGNTGREVVDEPNANLDLRQEQAFIDLLKGFPGTLICISHDLFFLYQICSRAVVLERGRIHHDFSMQDLVSQKDYLRDHGLDFTFRFSCCRENGEPPHPHPHRHLDLASVQSRLDTATGPAPRLTTPPSASGGSAAEPRGRTDR